MLINWKKDSVLVLPHVAGFKTVKLLPGINDIDNKYWAFVKDNKSIANKIATNMLIEIKPVNNTKATTELTKEVEEYTKKIDSLKKEKSDKEKDLKKARNKSDKEKIQDELDGISAEIEITKEEVVEKEAVILEQTSNFSKLQHSEKETMINECFDIETLEKWKAEDSKADVRNLILDRIAFIKKPKKK